MNMNLIFFLNLIFIVSTNIFGLLEGVIFSFVFILWNYYKKRNNREIAIFLGLLLILSINYNFKTIEKLAPKKLYNFQIDSISDRDKLIKVDKKYLKTNYYLLLDTVLEDGNYDVLGEVESIEENIAKIKVIKEIERNLFLKKYLGDQVDNFIIQYPYEFQNFTKAVLLGRKDLISDEIRDKFNYTGTSHILVISGLHIGIIIFTILFILKNLPYQIRYSLATIILTIYCYGVGFSPSVMRAYIMGIIFLGAKIFYEEREMTKALIIAFIVSSFINPYAIRSISYQMSYLALVGILFLYPKIKIYFKQIFTLKLNKYKIIDFLILSFSIQIILTPIFLYYFRVLPLFSFLPNLIVIPLGSILVQVLFIGLLFSFAGMSNIIIPLGYYLYKLLIFIIDSFYKIPFLTLKFYTRISLLLYIFLYVIIILFIVLKKEKIKKYWFIVFIIIPMVYFNNFQRTDNLDFKWGYYRKTPNRILILNKNMKRKDIFLLKDQKIQKLDYIITTNEISSELKEAFPNSINIVLQLEEGIKLDNEFFKNENGKIIKKEQK